MKNPTKFGIVAVLLVLCGLGLFVVLGGNSGVEPFAPEFAFDEVEQADPARPDSLPAADEEIDESARTELTFAEEAVSGPVSRLVYRGRVITAAGSPVPGATVRLGTALRGPGRPQGQTPPVQQAKTLVDGSFAIPAMAPRVSLWNVLVQHKDFAPFRHGGLSPAVAGEVLIGDLVIGKGGIIEGRVVDDRENGVAGAKVTIRTEGGPFRGRGFPAGGAELDPPAIEAVTVVGGAFRLTQVPRGELRLVAQHPERPSARSALVRLEDDARVSGVQIVLEPGLRVSGTVSAEGKGPLPGARVSIPSQAGALARGVLTDEKGSFTLPPLAPGRYELAATAEGWQPTVIRLTLEAEKSPEPVVLALKPGAHLSGRVVDAQGKPVTLFAARVIPADLAGQLGGQIPGQAGEGRGQGRGRFGQEAGAGLPGEGRAREAGFGREQERQPGRQQGQGQGAAGRDIGELLRQFQERMGGGQGLPPEAAQRIQERLGQLGIPQETVQQVQRGVDTFMRNPDELTRTAMNLLGQGAGRPRRPEEHPDGRFTIAGLMPARYTLEIRAPGFQTARSEVLDLTAQESIADLRIAVEPTLGIEGRVVARASGEPVTGARVMAMPSAGQAGGRWGAGTGGGPGGMRMFGGLGASTDTQGRFKIEDLAPGSYTVRVFADGYGDGRVEGVELALGAPSPQVEVPLAGPAKLTGRVTGFTQAERPNVMVAAMGARLGRPELAGIAPDGSFELTGLSPGSYYVRALPGFSQGAVRGVFRTAMQAGGGQPPEPDIVLEEDQVGRLDLVLQREPQGSVVGTLSRGGRPAVGARVELALQRDESQGTPEERFGRNLMDMAARVMGGPGGLSSEVDVLGGFRFSGLEPGTYAISATAQGRSRASLGSVQVYADQTSRIDLFWGSGALSGSLMESGLVVAGAQVRLRSLGDAAAGDPAALLRGMRGRAGGIQATTDGAGNFRIADLEPGRYAVEVTRRVQGAPPQTLPMGTVEIFADQESRLDLAWMVSSLRVRVLSDADGTPLSRATVFAVGAEGGGRPVGRAQTNEQGEAVLENLPSGPLRVFAMAQGQGRGEVQVEVNPGRQGMAELRLKSAEPGAEGLFPGGRRPGGEGQPGGRRPGGEGQPGGRRPGGEGQPGGRRPGAEGGQGRVRPGGNRG